MGTFLGTATGLASWGLLVLLFVGYHQNRYEDPAGAAEWLRSLVTIGI